uniref:Uncharacterized protein n=1 Tax=Picea glauca TaxID=3330 RepID=A0A101LXW4_PICGL|nr:hypothetical protein ABT39_MTgene5536 [Picea glauca]
MERIAPNRVEEGDESGYRRHRAGSVVMPAYAIYIYIYNASLCVPIRLGRNSSFFSHPNE